MPNFGRNRIIRMSRWLVAGVLWGVWGCGENVTEQLSKKSDTSEDSSSNSGTDTHPTKPVGIKVAPFATALTGMVLRGEKFPLRANFVDKDGVESPAQGTIWTVGDPTVLSVDADGQATALVTGKTTVNATSLELQAAAEVAISACQLGSKNPAMATELTVSGDQWPPQGKDALPPVFDDYDIAITGAFFVDAYQIFATVDQEVTVNWLVKPTTSTLTKIELRFVDCAGTTAVEHIVDLAKDSKTGSVKLLAKSGQRFSIFTRAQESITSRTYDLLFEKNAAFGLKIKN